ncbi:hypothetical protein [Blastomonas sp.]|uniref:hypothetical protein n=1 Tax=Blastomonas sp. TaxID=1909299 RepID=UPI003593AA51
MNGHDIPPSRWIINLVGWAIGGSLAFGLTRFNATQTKLRVIAVAGAMLVAASLTGPAQSGVHRWLAIGPLTINAAALALPAVVAAIACLPKADLVGLGSIGAIALVLVLQPDASQSLAFSAAIMVAACWRDGRRGAWLAAVLSCLTAVAFLRSDPLQPVAEVEQIFTLGWQISPLLAIAMAAALTATAASYLSHSGRPSATRALAAYAALAMLAPLYGWFPVPLAGSGMSFAIGLWLGVGVLGLMPLPENPKSV